MRWPCLVASSDLASRTEPVLQCRTVATVVFGVGYIGSRLVQELLYEEREVVAVDNMFATDYRAIEDFKRAPGFRFVEGSIVAPPTIEKALDLAGDVEAIYLLAAQASAHPEAAPPEYSEDVNLRAPRILLDVVRHRKLRGPVIYASSIRVYGAPLPLAIDESTPYGTFTDLSHLSKCYVEKLLEMYAALHGIRSRVIRLGLTYGVAPVMKTDTRFMTAPNVFCWHASQGRTLEIRTVDPLALIHVDDASTALIAAESFDATAPYVVANAVTTLTTLRVVADLVRQIAMEREMTVTVEDAYPGVAPSLEPVIHSRLKETRYSSRRQLSEGLSETFDYFRAQHR